MTDEAKALVERLRDFVIAEDIDAAADRIETLEAALRGVFGQWAGSEGFIPDTAPEGYLLQLTKRMADIARAALAGDSHDQ